MRTSGGPAPTGRADGVKSDPLRASLTCAKGMAADQAVVPIPRHQGRDVLQLPRDRACHVNPHVSVGGIMLGGPGLTGTPNGTGEAWQRMPVSSQLHNKKGQFTEKTEAGNTVRCCWNFQVIYLFVHSS
jgi:hypothetical protein